MKRPTVAAYYFPNWHVEPRNEELYGPGWTEWELSRRGEPRFPGHQQPKVPLWGYQDEADPRVFAQKVDAAADHGVDVFLFDWYWYGGKPFLQRCLDEGYLRAPNRERIRFACMWANHDWVDLFPAKANHTQQLRFTGKVSENEWQGLMTQMITYFKHPCHWLVDGAPYFSIYELYRFIDSFGGIDGAAAALADFRRTVQAAGFSDLHLNVVMWGIPNLPQERAMDASAALLDKLGVRSVDTYVWVHHVGMDTYPTVDYQRMADAMAAQWPDLLRKYGRPYHPNVSMGWDSSPRCCPSDKHRNLGYPFTPVYVGNTPERFAASLERAKLAVAGEADPVITINNWNEWTEGSYLEPDTVNGMAYLEAVKKVFGTR